MKKSFKIGVLAIQGAFAEHKNAFQNCALKFSITITMVEIRSADDITADLDGIVLPGGECFLCACFFIPILTLLSNAELDNFFIYYNYLHRIASLVPMGTVINTKATI